MHNDVAFDEEIAQSSYDSSVLTVIDHMLRLKH